MTLSILINIILLITNTIVLVGITTALFMTIKVINLRPVPMRQDKWYVISFVILTLLLITSQTYLINSLTESIKLQS